MWVLRGGPPDHPVVSFHYDPTRSSAVVERLLEYYSGHYFQCSDYAEYIKPCRDKNLVQLDCWDHARRKFKEAEKNAA